MLRFSVAIMCAALVFTSTSAAMAGTTSNGASMAAPAATNTISVGQSGSHIVIVLCIATPAAWTYDPASGGLSLLTPVPQMNQNPIGGIGLVVTKNPAPKKRGYPTPMPMNPNPRGSSAARADATVSYPTPMPMNPNGVAAFPPNMDSGNYDIVISIPAHAISTTGTGGTAARMNHWYSFNNERSATITFHVIVEPMNSASSEPQPRRVKYELYVSQPPTVVLGKASAPASSSQ